MNNILFADVWHPVGANDIDALIPELWAQEGLLLLESSMVAGNLVHRNFENQVAQFGDIVNTRLPATFEGKRKTNADSVTVQDGVLTNVAVPLNQHLHTSFLIKDGEESKSFQSLRDNMLQPAMLSLAEMVDEIVLTNLYDFMVLDDGTANTVGTLGTAAGKETIIAIREKLNENRVPMMGRNLILGTAAEADLLAVDAFISAEKIGDNGTALREASLGRKFGIQHWMSQNAPSYTAASGDTAVDILVNNAGGYPAGTTVITVDGRVAGNAVAAGTWVTVAGDDTPQRVTASAGAGTPTSLTLSPGLQSAVADDAVVTEYLPALVNEAAGYALNYAKDITIDGGRTPKTGQLVSFAGAVSSPVAVYGALRTPSATNILLNRPLEAAAADDASVFLGPAGNYSFAFHQNSMALVTRPLAAPQAGTGALSFVASYNGLSMRVTITYDGAQQGHLVTCDLLCGIKTLDRRLGCAVFSA